MPTEPLIALVALGLLLLNSPAAFAQQQDDVSKALDSTATQWSFQGA